MSPEVSAGEELKPAEDLTALLDLAHAEVVHGLEFLQDLARNGGW
jgi:hypothetical protein